MDNIRLKEYLEGSRVGTSIYDDIELVHNK